MRGRSEGNRFFRREFRALWRTRAYSRDRFYTAGEAPAKVSPTTRRKKHPFFARATTFHSLYVTPLEREESGERLRVRELVDDARLADNFFNYLARVSRGQTLELSLSLSLSISSSRSSRRNDLIEYDGNILRRCDNAGD